MVAKSRSIGNNIIQKTIDKTTRNKGESSPIIPSTKKLQNSKKILQK